MEATDFWDNQDTAQATLARVFKELGGASVAIAVPEVREALERGVVDAVTAPWGSMIRRR